MAATWIAMLAVAMDVFAPTLSRAAAGGRGGFQITAEICTAAGIARVAPEQVPSPASGQPVFGHDGEACPYCVVHAGSFALPPQDPSAVWVPEAIAVGPVDRPAARDPQAVWAAERSRGPPASI